MSWQVRFPDKRIALYTKGQIPPEQDAKRQEATAREILHRLRRQPGIVLADEVGMGKTFVALAVAASVIWADKRKRPVVVMVPPSLKEKWPRDFEVFCEKCLATKKDRDSLRPSVASSGVDLLKLLDDPAGRRASIIFLTHGALSNALKDPWTQLAIFQAALRGAHVGKRRSVLPRFVGHLFFKHKPSGLSEEVYATLLRTPPGQWQRILVDFGVKMKDDPVPDAIVRVLSRNKVDLGNLRSMLAALPIRSSFNINERLHQLRAEFGREMREIWWTALTEVRFSSPLLILDEAHHLKNPSTRLASLFVEPEAKEEADLLDGTLANRFDRMLFLTATPFQLGHHEILNVLDRFRGVRWTRGGDGTDRERLKEQLKGLETALNDAQGATTRLDSAWSTISRDDLAAAFGSKGGNDEWWKEARRETHRLPERIQGVMRLYEAAEKEMRRAESLLKPWVIRHLRPRQLPGSRRPRRKELHGRAITTGNLDGKAGLSVQDDALLPFLLAARCQALVARRTRSGEIETGRATFAEGLASSYEAFLETRAVSAGREKPRAVTDEAAADEADGNSGKEHDWYLKMMEMALPGQRAHAHHPKIRATVEKAVQLWREGEKVLIFCHYRATGRSLLRHISEALRREIVQSVSRSAGIRRTEVHRYLSNLSRRFDRGEPLFEELGIFIERLISKHPELDTEERDGIHLVARRFVRTPSFLARYYLPSRRGSGRKDFSAALMATGNGKQSLGSRLRDFLGFLESVCRTKEERGRYLNALRSIHTGQLLGGTATVRLSNGAVAPEERDRLMLAFNTPFLPEILVASSVLAEGVDLHLNCRHVIHHDLSWNPSTLEQRTGRVDRLGALAERVREPIHVYLPYVGETQDEKMYRVVQDRGRWFQVIMGEEYRLDEASTDALEDRVPLPEAAARELAFRLDVYTP